MKTKDIVLTANSNLLRSKLRTALTIIAIFVGGFTLSITSALGAGVSSYIDSQLGNLGEKDLIIVTAKTERGAPGDPVKYNPDQETANSDGRQMPVLGKSDLKKLETIPNVAKVTPLYAISPDYVEGPNGDKWSFVVGQPTETTNVDLEAGELMKPGGTTPEVILSPGYSKVLGFKNSEEAIGETVKIGIKDTAKNEYVVEARIAGVMAPGLLSAGGSVANNALKDALYEKQMTGLPEVAKEIYIAVDVKVNSTDAEVVEATKEAIVKSGDYNAFTIEDQLDVLQTVITAITVVLNGFAILALLAASFGIVNTLLMSVQERTKEIGLMKAMGMSPKRIFSLFSFEAGLVGFWGSLVGFGVAWITGTTINSMLADGLFKDLPGLNLFLFSPSNIAFVVILITGIALLSGTLPARRAAKLNPIDALRYE